MKKQKKKSRLDRQLGGAVRRDEKRRGAGRAGLPREVREHLGKMIEPDAAVLLSLAASDGSLSRV